jgi:RHS repeat-associated protein
LITTYTYDTANRMTKVGTTNYTWDNNGNLINDGSSLYRYDQANRMISTTLSGATTLFNYNGDGMRLKQVVAGVPTTYTQDLAAPLPVVLQAKTGTTATQYLFSLGTRPVAQYTSSAWQYLLADALGSVRQIVDASGNILLSESYEPYGKLLSSSGSGSSIFGYAGEQANYYIKLQFLRSRYYSPDTARFLSKDSWQGDYTRPQSLDAWAYTEGNPINRVDPSGAITKWDSGEADSWRDFLKSTFGIEIERDYGERCLGHWGGNICYWEDGAWMSLDEIKWVFLGVDDISKAMGGPEKFKSAMQGPVTIGRWSVNSLHFAPPIFQGVLGGDIILTDYTFGNTRDYAVFETVHEFGHVWDFKQGQRLSQGMVSMLGTQVCQTWYSDWLGQVCDCRFDIRAGKEPPPGDPLAPYAGTSAWEDWAEAFATYVYPAYYQSLGFPLLRPLRTQYVEDQIKAIP